MRISDWSSDVCSSDLRPGGRPLPGVEPEQQQSGQGEEEAGDGEDVDKPLPDIAGIAALVQVVEIADPAAARRLAGDFAAMPVDRYPAIAAGARQRQIDFVRRRSEERRVGKECVSV